MAKEIRPMLAKSGTPEAKRLQELIDSTARRYELDPLLIHSIIAVESAYNPYALSPKGAQGLMQLMPATARAQGVSNSFNIAENIEGGVKYFRYLKDLFQDDRLAIAAYNAGEGAVIKYGGIPPYAETEQYVYKVGKRWGDARRLARATEPAATESENSKAAPSSEPPLRRLLVQTGEDGRIYLGTQ